MLIKDFPKQQSQDFVAFFMSDIHLRHESLGDLRLLESFVDHLIQTKSKAKLFLLGDIFDFKFGFASSMKSQTKNLLKKLQGYNQIQASVIFFEGNHDVHLDVELSEKYGFEVVSDLKIVNLENQKIILEHGDLFDSEDKSYLFLRRFLRKPWLKFLGVRIVPGFLVSAIGCYFSGLSSKKTKVRTKEKTQQINEKFKTYAESQLLKHQANVFIAGHTHERLFLTDTNSKTTIINLGSWFDQKLVLGLKSDSTFDFYKI